MNALSSRQTLHAVQVYRGLAALLVALFHGNFLVGQWYGVAPFGGVFMTGFSGIYLFFTLSGFIILHAHFKDIGKPGRYLYYLGRRFIRIYPLYWLVFLTWGGWRLLAGRFPIDDFLLNAFLFSTTGSKPTITVAWTLLYEVIFYGVFSLVILNTRFGILAVLAWFAAILINQTYTLSQHPLLNPFSLLFIFGLGAGVVFLWARRLEHRVRDRLGALGFALGLLAFGGAMVYRPGELPAFGLASSLLLIASLSPSIEQVFARRRFLNLLGNASFSIYLVHLQIQKIAFNGVKSLYLTHWPHSPGAANTLLVWVVAVSVLAGIFVHLKIERPLLHRLKERLFAQRRADTLLVSETP